MIWYEIPGWPGYRVNYHAEVLSLKGADPHVMKTYPHRQVRLCRRGQYAMCSIPELMAKAGLQVPLAPEGGHDRCAQGHLWTPQNTMRRKGKYGDIRKCRECHRLAIARYRARKKAGLL